MANAVNLGLDFLFMGAFKMGIAGSSIATVTGYAVGFVMMSTHFIMKKVHCTLTFQFSEIPFNSLNFSENGYNRTFGSIGYNADNS